MKHLFTVLIPLLTACVAPMAQGSEATEGTSQQTDKEADAIRPEAASGWIRASQNFSPSSSVTISWGNCSSPSIYVSEDGGGPQLFATGYAGQQVASWIQLDHVYAFTLYCGGASTASTTVLGVGYESAGIGAAPHVVRVPWGGLGATHIYWGVNQHPFGWVTVSMDGAAEQTFAYATQGDQWANWIQPGHTYVFRVYEAYYNAPVTSVTVTGVGD